MSDSAPQVEVNAVEAPQEGEVLATAAVASAALSGAAVVEAQHADASAQEASAKADTAQATASQAAATAVTEEQVRALVKEGISESNAELATALAKVQAPAAPEVEAEVVVEAPEPDTPPANLKPKRKQTFREKYLGIESE
jgi:hypothetical protein